MKYWYSYLMLGVDVAETDGMPWRTREDCATGTSKAKLGWLEKDWAYDAIVDSRSEMREQRWRSTTRSIVHCYSQMSRGKDAMGGNPRALVPA